MALWPARTTLASQSITGRLWRTAKICVAWSSAGFEGIKPCYVQRFKGKYKIMDFLLAWRYAVYTVSILACHVVLAVVPRWYSWAVHTQQLCMHAWNLENAQPEQQCPANALCVSRAALGSQPNTAPERYVFFSIIGSQSPPHQKCRAV